MALHFERAGLATSIQDGGRPGLRHQGVPLSGAADTLSLALANWLVGKRAGAAAIEMTLTGATIRFEVHVTFALAGADSPVTLSGKPVELYTQCTANPGDVLEAGPARAGCRLYLAVSDNLQADEIFGSMATYAPAGFGGCHGQMIADGDVVATLGCPPPPKRHVPDEYVPHLASGYVLRAAPGPEAGELSAEARTALFTSPFRASQRASRQGQELDRPLLQVEGAGTMASSAVFPGTVQCPPSGKPYLLGPDAQTTGGYPRIAQVIRADRHLIGQVRPRDTVRFMETDADEAAVILREKNALYRELLDEDIF